MVQKNSQTTGIFALAYMVNTLDWDGRFIRQAADGGIEKSLDMLQSLGISKVMLSGYQFEEPADFDMFEGAGKIGKKLVSRGMRGSQHHGLAATYAPVGESQSEVKEKLERIVEVTALLEADCLVLHAGRIAGKHDSVTSFCDKYIEQVERYGIEEVIKVSAANIRYAGEIAAKLGLKIALENLGKFEPLSNFELLPRLINEVDLDNVGYCLDSGHAHACGMNPVAWVEKMENKLFTTHFHDNRGCPQWIKDASGFISSAGIDEHLPPGFGTISWLEMINALQKINYSYPITFESGGWPMDDERQGFLHAVNFWRTVERLVFK